MTAILKPPVIQRSLLTRQGVAPRGSNVTPFAPPARSRHEKQQLIQSQSFRSPQSLTNAPAKTVRIPITVQPVPSWLTMLVMAQRGSNILLSCLVAGVLAVYSWTVYSQHLWSSEYRRLETLQEMERDLTAANEVLKSQTAGLAENPNAGFTLPNSDNSIVLEPAPVRPPVAPTESAPSFPASDLPLGY